MTEPPAEQPPVTEPPAEQPPVTEPPVDQPPADEGQGGYPVGDGDAKDPGGSATAGEAPQYPESTGGLASTGW